MTIDFNKVFRFRKYFVSGFTQHHFFLLKKSGAGFTLTELLIVIAIGVILVAASVPIYSNLQVKAQLNESTTQVVQTLRLAREYSLSRYQDSAWGVLLDINLMEDDGYVLYKGDSYDLRDLDYDRETSLNFSLSFENLDFDLTGANIDINFSKGVGRPNNIGSMIMSHSVEGSNTIIVNSLGLVEED